MLRYIPTIALVLVVLIILLFPQVRRMLRKLSKTKWLALITACYVAWSSVFIYVTSYVAIDGNRYFNLFDDAMISMRYAWNFSHGNGLVWNQGEYIEGITNLLHVLHMAFWTAILDKSTAALMIQIMGIATMLGIAYLTMKIATYIFEIESLEHKNFYSILTFAMCLTYYPLSYWTLYGMETGLLALLLIASVYFIFRGVHNGTQISRIIPLLLGLAFMARPDAVVPAGVILLLKWYFDLTKTGRSHAIKSVILDSVIVVAIVGAVSLFRLSYYGSVFPNTYTLKAVGMPFSERISNGLIFIQRFLTQIAIPTGLVVVYLALKKRIYLFLMLLIFLSTVFYQVWVGGDAWPYWRMTSPTIPLFLILFLLSLDYLIKRISQNFERWETQPMIQRYVAIAAILVLMFGFNYHFLTQLVFYNYPFDVDHSWDRINTAVALNDIADPDATIAVTAAGTLPYYVDLRAIDMLGKSDEYIASLLPDLTGEPGWMGLSSVPGHNKYDLEYSIIQQQPTYVSTLRWGSDDVTDQVTNYSVFGYNNEIPLILNHESPHIDWSKVEETDIPVNDPDINSG